MESDSGPAPSKVSAGSLVAVFLITAITGTLLAYGILFLAAQARHCGEWSGMLLPGYQFGVPDHLYEKGVVPNCEVGWDGQFYYLQSNYLNPDPEAYRHIDAPPYRYQRIGLPLVAWCFAALTGADYVSPQMYLFASLPFLGIAMGLLAAWLFAHGYSPLWCLGWTANLGIPICLLHGQPDPLADAFFIIAMLALIRGLPLAYALAATMMCLTREPYFAIAATVLAASVVGLVPWKGNPADGGWVVVVLRKLGWTSLADRLMVAPEVMDNPTLLDGRPSAWNYWAYRTPIWQALVLAIPCGVFVAWQVYLYKVFGQTGSQSAGGTILDYPFVAFFRSSWTSPNYLMRPFYFAVMVLGFLVLWNVRRKWALSPILLPYFVVLTLMSEVIWIDFSGFTKAMGTVLATMVISLPLLTRRVRYVIAVVLVCAVLTYTQSYRRILGGVDLVPIPDYKIVKQITDIDQPILANPTCSIELDQARLIQLAAEKDGDYLFVLGGRRYPQRYVTIPITITNTGDQPWLRSRNNPIQMVYRWIRPSGRTYWCPGVELPYTIEPGQSFTREVPLLLPRDPGEFTLRITMRQGQDDNFDEREDGGYLEIPMTIR
ncbi:hypothetical protein [Blastopirellula marina]|uniref:Glycosyltransferase RgtA/B/C/D-like domain-containing protein n=1 Tax=Blastopirellula marina TaxID=124 RepID=A0A2S8F9M3_9BACT|nr:hypothetical protein [Blastopirellula marina]PQO28859.1 hypothetical protein C5Y98_24155 [Blastopirellula marina]PTL42132.1 hypothetical protein C5Y97_24170 [Blastopirellula marina]